MAIKAGRVGVNPADVDKQGHVKVETYELPPATGSKLGGIMVGTGLTASETGKLDIKVPVPEYSAGSSGKVLSVNEGGDGLEWVDPPSGGGGGNVFEDGIEMPGLTLSYASQNHYRVSEDPDKSLFLIPVSDDNCIIGGVVINEQLASAAAYRFVKSSKIPEVDDVFETFASDITIQGVGLLAYSGRLTDGDTSTYFVFGVSRPKTDYINKSKIYYIKGVV